MLWLGSCCALKDAFFRTFFLNETGGIPELGELGARIYFSFLAFIHTATYIITLSNLYCIMTIQTAFNSQVPIETSFQMFKR